MAAGAALRLWGVLAAVLSICLCSCGAFDESIQHNHEVHDGSALEM